jgi:hypothetical protein
VTSVDRTAYPVFPRLFMARELYTFFSPTEDELAWVRALASTDEHTLAMAVWLKCFQKLSRFPKAGEVPEAVVDHVRRCLGLPESVAPVHGSARSAEHHRKLIRKRVADTPFHRLKKPARRPTWTKFKEQEQHLVWVDGLADTETLLKDVAPLAAGPSGQG